MRIPAALRIPETGLVIVILLLGLLLTLGGGSITVGGQEVNAFLRLDNLISNVATPMSLVAIMALGATVVIAAGGIDISVGSMMCLAALSCCAALQRLPVDASPWLVGAVGVSVPLGVGLLCGLANGALVVGLRMHPFIVTLGTLSIFRGLALISVPTKSLPTPDRDLPAAFTEHGIGAVWTLPGGGGAPLLLQPVPMAIMLLCAAAAWVFLAHTPAGRSVYAVGGNEEASRFSGIPVGRIKLMVYALSGLCAGIAGMVSAGLYRSANTATAEGAELMVIASAVVGGASLTGGRGTALGALLGALVIKLIDNGTYILNQIDFGLFTLKLSREYYKIVVGAAIIVAVAVDRLSEWLRARRG